ncbi:MAG: hypothetical protein J0L64_08445 [Acidobacteria bacterium]|nr:hypothetical protein [Acidobacteriota bacterium]
MKSTKRTQPKRGSRKPTPQDAQDALTLLDRAARHRAAPDGALELAVALASLTRLVTVDLRQKPFRTEPADLFDLTFAGVGLNDGQMGFLREQLKRLLPAISGDLDANSQVLDQPNHRIGDYAQFLKVALLLNNK